MTADIITYRLGEKHYCYIVAPKTYDAAIQAARDNYKELKDVDPARITLCVNSFVGAQPQRVRISPDSWPIVLSRLSSRQVVEIVLQPSTLPDIVVHAAEDVDSLPTYEGLREQSRSKDSYLAAPPSQSAS
ncbi:hypothetical protein BD311DRAFT_671539 [Dichomitus squalens]|uniref:Uncharacterized protein n=1 Tax=Dichomitus squalens TaxID=114155 RepID=A0A4Q9MER7_9APHY|nr:hypothetical protein BD311DRAFT_671539 [Dichomitus squalens]